METFLDYGEPVRIPSVEEDVLELGEIVAFALERENRSPADASYIIFIRALHAGHDDAMEEWS